MHTFHIEHREPIKVRKGIRTGGSRWYVTRGEYGLTVRAAGVMRHASGWCVHTRYDLSVSPADRHPRVPGLTYREADRIARVFVRSGRVLTAAYVRLVRPARPRRDDAAANDAKRPLLVAFGFATR